MLRYRRFYRHYSERDIWLRNKRFPRVRLHVHVTHWERTTELRAHLRMILRRHQSSHALIKTPRVIGVLTRGRFWIDSTW